MTGKKQLFFVWNAGLLPFVIVHSGYFLASKRSVRKIALNSKFSKKEQAFGRLVRLQDSLFLYKTDWLPETKKLHLKDMSFSVTAHHLDSTSPCLDCGQEKKKKVVNTDNPPCLRTQVYRESTDGYSAETLTSPITMQHCYSTVWLLLTESASICKANHILRND